MTAKKNEYRSTATDHAVHDVGGLDFGAIDFQEHDLEFWERRIDAMLVLLATKKNAFTVDAMRRVIESYGEQQYDSTMYHEKWIRAIRNLIIEQGIITREELEAQLVKSKAEMQAQGREISDADVPWNEGLWQNGPAQS